MTFTEGIDISGANALYDEHAVFRAGKRFVVAKVNEGDSAESSFGPDRVHRIRAGGMIPGGYDYLHARPERTGAVEFDRFWEIARDAGLYRKGSGWYVRPWFDFERTPGDIGRDEYPVSTPQGRRAILKYITQWVQRCERRLGAEMKGRNPRPHPMAYLGSLYRDDPPEGMGNPEENFNCLLVLPVYGTDDIRRYVPRAWPRATIHQYSGDVATVPGIRGAVDLDRYRGNLDSFKRRCCVHL